jgi:hypothetical protein
MSKLSRLDCAEVCDTSVSEKDAAVMTLWEIFQEKGI